MRICYQRNASRNAPYTFSGKEKDVETGYGYFGARYYDSGLSICLSVDPMAENTPFASPYAYCINNPIILHDPDGQDWFVNENTGQVFFNSEMGKNAAGTGNMKGDGWTWMGANDMFGEVNDEFFANNSEFNTGNNCFQAWETKGLDGERTNGYEMDFAGKSSAFMSKMGYNKVLKSAIAKITTKTFSSPDAEGPGTRTEKSEDLSMLRYTYAKKGLYGSYTSSLVKHGKSKTHFGILDADNTSIVYEQRQYSYSQKKPGFKMNQDVFNFLLENGGEIIDLFKKK
jgi:RHS repeat-associated protein